MATHRGAAEKWIYPKIGAMKLKDFKAIDADAFFKNIAKSLSRASLVKIKGTLARSIQRAQKFDLIGRHVVELIDLPKGQPGHPSRAMTEEQATQVLRVATGQTPTRHTRDVRVSKTKYGATHAATEQGKLACGTQPREERPAVEVSTDLSGATCRFCRAEIGLDKAADAGGRLEALFVVALTLGMRPGELRSRARASAHAPPRSAAPDGGPGRSYSAPAGGYQRKGQL